MLFKTVVLLTSRVNLLMKGVAPAVWPVIVIVVSSAWLAPARLVKTMKTAPTTIDENFFIRSLFLLIKCGSCRRRPFQSSKNFAETHLFLEVVELRRAVRSWRE